jgi:hypothetical protein
MQFNLRFRQIFLKFNAFSALLVLQILGAKAQFPGAAGTVNSTAIHKDSSVFVAWASSCTVTRGFMDLSNPSLGYATAGTDSAALGKAGENGVVSLGDAGAAVLSFAYPLFDGPGFDFAVFENGFSDQFLELAFVEVSSNGVDFVRFPAESHLPFSVQIGPFDLLGDASKLNNLAGKYRVFYGTPFDLEELKNHPLLDVNAITHIKVVDVVGSVLHQYASFDINGNPINDPWPTPFETCGFDLDAVGAIHMQQSSVEHHNSESFRIYPNPFHDTFKVTAKGLNSVGIEIMDLQGKLLLSRVHHDVSLPVLCGDWPSGLYILKIKLKNDEIFTKKLIKK